MISLTDIVWTVVFMIGAGAVFGLLKLLIDRAPFLPDGWKPTANYILLVMAVLVLIGIILSLMTKTPLIRMNNRAPVFQNKIIDEQEPLSLTADETYYILTY